MILVEKDEIYVELHTAVLCEENEERIKALEYAIELLDSCTAYEIDDNIVFLGSEVLDFPTNSISIRNELRALKIKQYEVAKELHISESTLIRWLRDETIENKKATSIKEACEKILKRRYDEDNSIRQ